MKTTMTRRTPAKTRIRNFFGHRPTLRALSSHNPAEYKQVATQPLRTMHGTPRYGDNVMADIVDGSVVRSCITPMLDQNVSMTVHDGVDNPVYYYNQDERWSVVNLTDDTGVVTNDYAYSAYGDKVDALTGGDVEQRYTYTGRELSDTTEDYYFRYRWYGAGVGSFMSRDLLGYVDGLSVYNGYFSSWIKTDAMGKTADGPGDDCGVEPCYVKCEKDGGRKYGGKLQCFKRCEKAHELFMEWYNGKHPDFNKLPDCECNLKKCRECRWKDSFGSMHLEWVESFCSPGKPWSLVDQFWYPFYLQKYHPGAVYDLRSEGSPSQQCTYDQDGKLITHGTGAGTVDAGHAGTDGHYEWDVYPADWAMFLDGNADSWPSADGGCFKKYIERRPINQGDDGKGEKCPKNP